MDSKMYKIIELAVHSLEEFTKNLKAILAEQAPVAVLEPITITEPVLTEPVLLEPVPEPKPIVVELAHRPSFSAQEMRILNALVSGQSNKVIARQLNIAEATVKVHVKAVLRKLRLDNRTQAAVWAFNNSLNGSAVNSPMDQDPVHLA